jgi:hypothetical protein
VTFWGLSPFIFVHLMPHAAKTKTNHATRKVDFHWWQEMEMIVFGICPQTREQAPKVLELKKEGKLRVKLFPMNSLTLTTFIDTSERA